MTTAQRPTTPAAPAPSRNPYELRRNLDHHVTEARRAGLDEAQIARSLQAAGWLGIDVDLALDRTRRHRGSFGYTWLFFSLGFAALSLAGASHVFLDGLRDDSARTALVGWLTLLFCSAPFAVAAVRWVLGEERRHPSMRDNPLRRQLGMTLLWVCGIVGMARLAEFVARFFSVLVKPDASPGADPFASFAQVVVTVAIAGGVFWWTWDLLHRSDDVES